MSTDKKAIRLVLRNARLSYPNLHKAVDFEGDQQFRFSATFILDKVKNKDSIDALRQAVGSIITRDFQLQPKDHGAVKICVRDGSERSSDGYGPGVVFLNAKTQTKPKVLASDAKTVLEEGHPGNPYAGCYVDGVIDLFTSNKKGKRVNAALVAVKFCRDGEPFGKGDVKIESLGLVAEPGAITDDPDDPSKLF